MYNLSSVYQKISYKANLQLCSSIALIHLRSTSGQPKLLYLLPEQYLSTSILIYQNPVQPIYMQIFNKKPQLI